MIAPRPLTPLSSAIYGQPLPEIQTPEPSVAHSPVFRFDAEGWIIAFAAPRNHSGAKEREMPKKQETVLTDVAGRIGSALGVVAAEAAKMVRPLATRRSRARVAHTVASAVKKNAAKLTTKAKRTAKKTATASKRQVKRTMRKRVSRSA